MAEKPVDPPSPVAIARALSGLTAALGQTSTLSVRSWRRPIST